MTAKATGKTKPATVIKPPQTPDRPLLTDVRQMIMQARESVARTIDSGLTMLYWNLGRRIRQDVLKEKRAEYGAEIVSALGRQLESEFGRGFGRRNLFRMIRFAEVFPDPEIVSALLTQLGWTHFLSIISIDDPLKRDFYTEMCRIERWSTRTLEKKIQSMLFERTALSRKPEQLAAIELTALRDEDKLTPDLVFRDPYLLDFLGLKDTYAEKDLEAAIGKRHETVELLDLDKSGIHIASYWTEALPKAELEHKLHEAVLLARARMGRLNNE
jgi:predicted nuclease of restriction endonuclease-like (RecB) superfamily